MLPQKAAPYGLQRSEDSTQEPPKAVPVNSELSGYARDAEISPYRMLHTRVYGAVKPIFSTFMYCAWGHVEKRWFFTFSVHLLMLLLYTVMYDNIAI